MDSWLEIERSGNSGRRRRFTCQTRRASDAPRAAALRHSIVNAGSCVERPTGSSCGRHRRIRKRLSVVAGESAPD